MNILILLTGAALLLMICLTNRLFVRQWTYPPTIFAGWWAILLLSFAVFGSRFYRISIQTVFVYVLGALFFSLGAALALPLNRAARVSGSVAERSYLGPVLDICLLLMVSALPFYWRYIQEVSAESGFHDFWYGVRAGMLKMGSFQDQGIGKGFAATILDNLVVFGMLITLIAFTEYTPLNTMSRLRSYVAISFALAYALMTASNIGMATVLLSVFAILWLKSGQMSKKALVLCSLSFLIAFSSIAVLVKKGRATASTTALDNVDAVLEVLEAYTFGGIVAFDQVVHDPPASELGWGVFRFFPVTANKLGANLVVPPPEYRFTMISPTLQTNVYTVYAPYFKDYGWLGVFIIMSVLGTVASLIHAKAKEGVPEAVGFYGITFSGIILSGFGEEVFDNLNFHLKAMAFLCVVYRSHFVFRRNRIRSRSTQERLKHVRSRHGESHAHRGLT